jgi:hypothetical protein
MAAGHSDAITGVAYHYRRPLLWFGRGFDWHMTAITTSDFLISASDLVKNPESGLARFLPDGVAVS